MPVVVPPPVLSPPLKWAGGKRWQVRHLRDLWAPHRHRRLVEPFCGGLAVALGLQPERALLNDANPHLINFYRWLQKGLTIDVPMQNSRTLFYEHRARFNELLADRRQQTAEAAALFYFLNRTCFNGLCRFNRKGAFNVPFGQYTRIPYVRDFSSYQDVLGRWTFTTGDLESVALTRHDFIYADPPYDVPFTQYSRGGFSWDDQVRAAYRDLDYTVDFLSAPRRISRTGDRTPAKEILATRHL